MMKQKLVKYVFIALFMFEVLLCYNWLIEPLMPIIKNIIANKGALSFNAGVPTDISHPLGGFSIGGMNGQSAMSLWFDTIFRFALFSLIFGVTAKAYRIVRTLVR